MDLLQELSTGLLIDFREKQKGKLQRTFVSGMGFISQYLLGFQGWYEKSSLAKTNCFLRFNPPTKVHSKYPP